MTPPTIIALAGLAGAGKSTVAGALHHLLIGCGGERTVSPFSARVKRLALNFGYNPMRLKKTPEERRLLESLTVAGEEFKTGFWADLWAQDALWGMPDKSIIIAPDHRGCPGFDALIAAHGGFHYTIMGGLPEDADPEDHAPQHPTLRAWDAFARKAGVPIQNSARDAGASAAAAILADMKRRGWNP
jgi:hypothetical protein